MRRRYQDQRNEAEAEKRVVEDDYARDTSLLFRNETLAGRERYLKRHDSFGMRPRVLIDPDDCSVIGRRSWSDGNCGHSLHDS